MKKQKQKKQYREPQESFLDPGTLIAVVVVGLMWFLWQSHMNKKYPPGQQQAVSQPQQGAGANLGTSPQGQGHGGATPTAGASATGLQTSGQAQETAGLGPERLISYEDDTWQLQISSHNMGVKKAVLKTYQNSSGEPVQLVGDEELNSPLRPFSTKLLMRNTPAQNINFKLQQQGASIVGTAFVKGLKIVRRFDIKPFSIEASTRVERAGADFIGLQLYLTAKVDPSLGATSFLIPSFERQEFYIDDYQNERRLPIDPQAAIQPSQWPQAHITALSTQYFGQAILDRSSVRPEFRIYSLLQNGSPYVYGQLDFKRLNQSNEFSTQQSLFLGPKKYAALARVDRKMINIIDFGWFSSIAKGILFLMQFFHQYISNWGLNIILLTLIVRLLVLPFNLVSYKSMRAMAKVQPLIKQIQEKYKDKPAEKNQHIMQIMRDNKANPLMGCLPMLLQIPVFFALYRVLASSVDLYHAPFMLWINDLSTKDPYYILPILVGASFFIQQKITPNTMDETQRKVMMFLPLMFTVFMLNLPSGLTLYIFINTLFGLVQQYIFTKRTQ